MPAITRLVAVTGKARVRVHIDGAYWETLPLALVVEEDLCVGLEIDLARLETLSSIRMNALGIVRYLEVRRRGGTEPPSAASRSATS